ncbi:MAG: universal stress protein, partial [Spirulinaceae cyanobacterium]
MIKKILFAYSGTENSEQMLKYLREIPAIKNASINILHVVPSQITTDNMAEKLEEGGKILGEVIQS